MRNHGRPPSFSAWYQPPASGGLRRAWAPTSSTPSEPYEPYASSPHLIAPTCSTKYSHHYSGLLTAFPRLHSVSSNLRSTLIVDIAAEPPHRTRPPLPPNTRAISLCPRQ